MKTILLPIDYSPDAWNAIFTAFKLFRKADVRFLLLNTYEPSLVNVLGDHGEKRLGMIYESLEAESRGKMKKVLEELSAHELNPGFEVKTRCAPGDLIAEVKKLVDKDRADLIVMGTKGATGAERVFMGSNAVRMIAHITNRPVLAVPGAYNFQQLQKVVLPTDFMHFYETFELQPLLELAGQWGAEIHAVHASGESRLNPTQESHREVLRTRLEGLSSKFVEIPLKTSISDAIRSYALSERADLIALLQHRHNFFEAFTKEKVVKRIAFDTQIPLLVLPKHL